MKMTKEKQKELVLLQSLAELNSGSSRKQVLEYIQQSGYWYKNDQNDCILPTRNEKTWRNDFSYVRMHLVDKGYMLKHANGNWYITETGEDYLHSLKAKLKQSDLESITCLTPTFLQKLESQEQLSELTADYILIEQLLELNSSDQTASLPLQNEPLPKGKRSNRSGTENAYQRDPRISQNALNRAGNCCEIDPTHPSFLRRNEETMYMEPHHLIPMSETDHFDVSLDREQNIFCLCSNCHNQIHYGTKEDVRQMIRQLFGSRKQEISSILGKNITLEEIFKIYKV